MDNRCVAVTYGESHFARSLEGLIRDQTVSGTWMSLKALDAQVCLEQLLAIATA